MKQILTWLGKGILAVLPAAATIYAVYWLFTLLEGMFAPMLLPLLGERFYFPGSGLVLAVVVLIAIGVLIEIYVGRMVLDAVERGVDRVPVVKTIYGAVRDLLHFAIPGENGDSNRRVVAWEGMPGVWLVGFVTGPAFVNVGEPGEERFTVYFPMSYQIGGYSLLLRDQDLTTLDMSVEDAMKAIVTAGVLGPVQPGAQQDQPAVQPAAGKETATADRRQDERQL
jgi:uncharacterized membrane protein